jgi:hypothetical protein
MSKIKKRGVKGLKHLKLTKLLSASVLTFSLAAPLAVSAESDEEATEVVENEESVSESTLEQNLFSYITTMNDQLKLALSEDQMERASLLVDLSDEAIAEAQELFEQGKVEEATELLTKATEALKSADEIANDDEEEIVDEEVEEADEEEDIEVIELDDDLTEEDDVVELDEESSDEENKELETKIGQNVISLTLNLHKVKNPKAKAALERNIERSLERLKAKYGDISDLEEILAKINEEAQEDVVDEEADVEEETNDESVEEEESTEDDLDSDSVDEDESEDEVDNESEEEATDEDDQNKGHGKGNKENKGNKGNKGNNGKGNNGKGNGNN